MSRLFIFVMFIFLIVIFFKRKKTNGHSSTSAKKSNNTGETMVKCAQCGVHLPVSEALTNNQQYYCCESHLPHP